jgi:hypothetical protein
VDQGEIDALFDIHIRYLIEGIRKDVKGGRNGSRPPSTRTSGAVRSRGR